MSAAENLRCPACGNPSRDGGLCDMDEEILAAVLKAAPELLDELLTQTARLNVSSLGGTKNSEKPLPINLKASDLAAGYENLLISWARACGGDDDPALVVAGREAAQWLARRIYQVRLHVAAGDIVAELSEHARACMRAIDRRSADDVYLGDCEALLPPNDIECKTPLRVKPGVKRGTCWRCEALFEVDELLAKRDAIIDGSLATAREIADAQFRTPDRRLITLKMIEGYIEREVILPKGTKHLRTLDRHVATYSIAEVKEAAMKAKYPKAHLTSKDMKRTA